MNKRNRPPIDEDNYDAYADEEIKLASRRFQQQRLGSEPARQEEELATSSSSSTTISSKREREEREREN